MLAAGHANNEFYVDSRISGILRAQVAQDGRLLAGAVLRTPQKHIAADRSFHPRLKPSLPVEQHERNAATGKRPDQRRRYEDATEYHDAS